MKDAFFGEFCGRFPENPPHHNHSDTFPFWSKPKKVVSIPINFFNSNAPKSRSPAVKIPMDKATAAVKIQAIFRGFSVRKTAPLKKLRVIMKTKSEAAEIRRRISDYHVAEMLRLDEKERVKMTEWIMSLLLRLDAVLGVNSFVRESRKAVTRELVNLQETVDDMIAGKSMQEMDIEASVSCEVPEDKCLNVEANDSAQCLQGRSNEEIKGEEFLGQVKAVAVNDAKAEQNEMQQEESLHSQTQDLQMEASHENEKEKNSRLENFEQGFLEVQQTLSGPEECTTVDGTGEDAMDTEKNKFENPVLKPGIFCSSSCTEEDVMTRNSRDCERSSEAMDLLQTETIEVDGRLNTDDDMDYEEVRVVNDRGDELSKLAVEDIGMAREENERLKQTVAYLLKKSEKQTDIINNISLRVAQLEEQVSMWSKKKETGEGRKKSRRESNNASGVLKCEENQNAPAPTSTEEKPAHPNDKTSNIKSDRHLNDLLEDWFRVSSTVL